MTQINKARGERIERLVDEWIAEHFHGIERGGKSELARRSGIDRGALYRWMAGGEMELSHLELLCRFFKTTPQWVMHNTGPMHVTEPNVGGVDALEAQAQAVRDHPDEEGRQVRRERP